MFFADVHPKADTSRNQDAYAAHALCEHKLKRALHMRSRRPVSDYDSDEMEECTGARMSHFHGWEPVSINGGAEKYSVSVLIPTSDTETVSAINAAIDAAIEEGVAKFGGKKPSKAAIKLPLRDGDVERDDEAYKGHWFINANSTTAPQIVDRQVKPILDRSEVYSGCYARVSLNFFAFNSNGNKGIACGLGNIQKVRDGEPLGGKSTAADDFATLADDDFLA